MTQIVTVREVDNHVSLPLKVGGNTIILRIPSEGARRGIPIQVPGTQQQIYIQQVVEPKDDLNNYVIQFMQWFLVILQLKDSIKEGDIERTNVTLKVMVPFFYSHSNLSKYYSECIDYILKTELVLSPQLSLRVRASSFVSPFGGVGMNKAADLHKENQVKFLKELIKGLGANKTKSSIISVTKAAPAIANIVSRFDTMLNIKTVKTTHKTRSRERDILEIITKLNQLDVWTVHPNRTLGQFKNIPKSPFNFNLDKFKYDVQSTADRLLRDLPDPEEEEEDDHDDD